MSTPYAYLASDPSKTPVDPNSEPEGTKMIMVSSTGRDIPFTVGKRVVNSPTVVDTAYTHYRNRPEGV